MTKLIYFALALAFCSVPVWAQQANSAGGNAQNAELEQKIRDLEDRVIALEGKIRTMEAAQSAQPTSATPQPGAPSATASQQAAAAQQPAPQAPAPVATSPATPSPNEAQAGLTSAQGTAPVPVYGGSSAAAKALNPDISVIGDFIGAAGGNTPPPLATLQPFPSFQMHESEIGMQAIIDPYACGDFFFSFGEQGVNVEEGYITFTALPFGLVAK